MSTFKMRNVVLVLSIIVLSFSALISSAEKTNKIIVKLKPQVSVEEVKAAHPFVKFERASTLPRVFVFTAESINDADQEVDKFISDSRIVWAQIDEIREDQPDVLPTDPSLQSGEQWFHNNINSSYAWSKGLSGQGQIVQVIDTPVYPEDLDLRNQLDLATSFEGNVTEAPAGSTTHGTVCTNIIVSEANDFCGVGVAYSSRAAVFPFIANRARVFSELQFAEAYALGFPVSSNSYGSTQCFTMWGCNLEARGLSSVIQDAFELAQDRNNTVFVFTSGNEGTIHGSPNFRAFGSTPRILVVGATRYNGTRAGYSNVGPANWIVAPAGDHGDLVTWTSTVVNNEQRCGTVGVGTSYAAPMVSAAAAILRSAYPALSWRDVKYILAYSADKTDPNHASWLQNGAGRWFSNHYGFGQLNVGKAVELGATWKNVGPLQIRTFHSNLNTPIAVTVNESVITSPVSVPAGIISKVESVQLTLNLEVVRRGEVQVDLISPAGTICVIFPIRNDLNRHYRDFVTSANCFLDENPAGQWSLRVTRRENSLLGNFNPLLNSFAVTVWGEAVPSKVQLLTAPSASRLSSFTIKEGDTFQQLELFHNYPEAIGLFWKDAFGLYGELFSTQGKPTTGTQRLNPSNSDHPTISVFYGGDHVLTYLTTTNDSVVMSAEVRNIDFIPLTPLTVLPFEDINPEYLDVAAIENSIVVSYKSSGNSLAKLVLLNINFGSRDTTPLCVPTGNLTSEADTGFVDEENNCTEIIYRRDGKISFSKQTEIGTTSPVRLHSIGMNLVLGTWIDGQAIKASLFKSNLYMRIVQLQAPVTSVVRAAATPEDVFIAFGHSQGVLVERYDMNMNLRESFAIPTNDAVVSISLAYTHVEGLSLVIATSKNISVTTLLRSYDRTFVQTNQATIASMMSTNVPVLDIDQSVMPNGDLVVTFSTIQEIHVQVFDSSIFGTAPRTPPVTVNPPLFVNTPVYKAPVGQQKPPTIITPQDEISADPNKGFPWWGVALIVIGGLMALFFAVVFVLAQQRKRRNASRAIVQQDPDLIAYTKMSV